MPLEISTKMINKEITAKEGNKLMKPLNALVRKDLQWAEEIEKYLKSFDGHQMWIILIVNFLFFSHIFIFLVMFIFISWIILSFVAGAIGSDKSCGFWGAFIISLVFSPIIGFIVVIASGPSKKVLAERIKQEEILRKKVREELDVN